MILEIGQDEIDIAIRDYCRKIGIEQSVEKITIVAGRKGNGNRCTLEIAPDMRQVHQPALHEEADTVDSISDSIVKEQEATSDADAVLLPVHNEGLVNFTTPEQRAKAADEVPETKRLFQELSQT
jgi:hypothetical protein